MVIRDPALVISLLSQSTSSNSRPICTNDGDLVIHTNSLLGSRRGALGTLATLTTALCLREKSLNPGLVDEVQSSSDSSREEEVQKYARSGLAREPVARIRSCLHLGIKNAGSSVDYTNSLIESLDLVNCTGFARDDRDQIETKVLWVQVGGESIGKRLLLAGRNFYLITGSRQVANDASTGVRSRGQWL